MRALLLASAVVLGWAGTAKAAYIVTFAQAGGNVVATGSGSINLGGLAFNGNSFTAAAVLGNSAFEATGAAAGYTVYAGAISGPSSFGTGNTIFATVGTGDIVGVNGSFSQIAVPVGYVSGAPLSDTATYAGQTFASLGLTPGTYVYSLGSRPNLDTFTVQIGPVIPPTTVPEPATLALLSTGVLGLGLVRRRRRA